jgi:hypothetical protein
LTKCSNGHAVGPDDWFCPACGAWLERRPASGPPPIEDNPDSGAPEARESIAEDSLTPPPDAGRPAGSLQDVDGAQRSKRKVLLVMGGVLAAAVITGVVVATNSSSGTTDTSGSGVPVGGQPTSTVTRFGCAITDNGDGSTTTDLRCQDPGMIAKWCIVDRQFVVSERSIASLVRTWFQADNSIIAQLRITPPTAQNPDPRPYVSLTCNLSPTSSPVEFDKHQFDELSYPSDSQDDEAEPPVTVAGPQG